MNCNCGCRNNCTLLSIGASIILGIVAAFLQFTAVITITPAFLFVVFGISGFFLAAALAVSAFSRSPVLSACLCLLLPILLTGIFGAILAALILLGITFGAGSILGAIFTGALIGFFALVLTTVACLTLCLANCDTDTTS